MPQRAVIFDSDKNIRNVVFNALNDRVVFGLVGKLSTMLCKDDMSSVMLGRMVMPSRDLESTIRVGLASGAFGTAVEPGSDVRDAFGSIGQERSFRAAVTAGLFCMVSRLLNSTPIEPKRFMQHAMATAAGCEVIADHIEQPRKPFYAAGLYHLIGLAVLAASNPYSYGNWMQTLPGGTRTLMEAERAEFGYDHGQAGAYFLAASTFPDYVSHVALAGRGADESSLTVTVALCSAIAHEVGCTIGFANAGIQMPSGAISQLGLTDSVMAKIAERMAQAVGQASALVV